MSSASAEPERPPSDRTHVQCRECGDWFKTLGTHINASHGLTADEYRARWKLASWVPLAAEEQRVISRANALYRHTHQPATDRGRFAAGAQPSADPELRDYERTAERYWEDRLAHAGWTSWDEAVTWADSNQATWYDIAERLDTNAAKASKAARVAGVRRQPAWQHVIDTAEEHVREHGSLLNARGEFSVTLSRLRHEARKGTASPALVRHLDALDPDWRANRSRRQVAAARRSETTHWDMNAAEALDAQLRAAGFDSATQLLAWGITNHKTPNEVGKALGGTRSDYLFTRLRRASGPDPFEATRDLISSRHGHLADDGSRVQCHECGLWQPALAIHLRIHRDPQGAPMTSESYRRRHGLPDSQRLATAGVIDRGQIRQWQERLHKAGFESWQALLRHGAIEHLGFTELAPLLGSQPQTLMHAIRNALHGDWSATESHRLSRPGYLANDGRHVQCHECGLWFRKLGTHIRSHTDDDGTPLTADTYRIRHGLSDRLRVSGDPAYLIDGRPRRTEEM